MPFPEHVSIDEVRILLDEYEQFLSGKAQGTREAYLRTVRHLIGWVAQSSDTAGPFQPHQLTPTVVELYLAHLEQEGLSLCHRARVKSTISTFARFLIEEKRLLRRNPTRSIDLPPLLLPGPHPLSREQRGILRGLVGQQADLRGAALFALCYRAGCRVSDLSWLTMADTHVGSEKGWLRVGTRESTQRNIPLLKRARQPLYAYLQAVGSQCRYKLPVDLRTRCNSTRRAAIITR